MKKTLTSAVVFYFLVESIFKLIYLEIQSARKHFVVLLIQGVIFFTLLVTFWGSIVFMSTFALHDVLGKWLPAIAIIALIHVIFLSITMVLLNQRSKKLDFFNSIKVILRERLVEQLRVR